MTASPCNMQLLFREMSGKHQTNIPALFSGITFTVFSIYSLRRQQFLS